MAVRIVPSREPVPLVERLVWRLARAQRTAVAVARDVPGIGLELVITIDGELRWAALYRGGLGLGVSAAEKRRALEERGWRDATERPEDS